MSVAPLVAALADDIPSGDAAPAKAGDGPTAVNATAATVATTAARLIDEIMSFRANISNPPCSRPSLLQKGFYRSLFQKVLFRRQPASQC
jgi:hypothetical protein